jgi:hypothetical protein
VGYVEVADRDSQVKAGTLLLLLLLLPGSRTEHDQQCQCCCLLAAGARLLLQSREVVGCQVAAGSDAAQLPVMQSWGAATVGDTPGQAAAAGMQCL